MRLLNEISVDDVADNARDLLDVQPTAAAIRTGNDSRVILQHMDDGAMHLRVIPTSTPAYELTCPADMPFLTLIKIMESL